MSDGGQVAFLDISTDLLTELCNGLSANIKPRSYVVSKNPLPGDAKALGVSLISEHTIRIALQSSEFIGGEVLPSVWLESLENESPKQLKALEKRLDAVERWIENEDTRALEASEY
jgi:hypothetical protein